MKLEERLTGSPSGGTEASGSNHEAFTRKKTPSIPIVPRYLGTDTGVSSKKEGTSFKIDWLSFTIPVVSDLDLKNKPFRILRKLGYKLDDFEEIPGLNFYNSGISYGGGFVKVLFNDHDKPLQPGSHDSVDYIFTGVGCTDLSEKINNKWLELLNWLRDQHVSFKRIDIALDDFNSPPLVDFNKIKYKLDRKEFLSAKRYYNLHQDFSTTGGIIGQTWYCGKRSKSNTGATMLRVYDKYLQMIYDKHQESQLPLPVYSSGSWIRWEIEFSKQKAAGIIDLMLERQSIADAYYSILVDIIKFVKPTKGKNGSVLKDKRQWDESDWWTEFCENAKKAKLQEPEQQFNLDSVLSWISMAVVPSLQMLQEIYSRIDIDIYNSLAVMYKHDYSKKQKRLIEQAKTVKPEKLKDVLRTYIYEEDGDS